MKRAVACSMLLVACGTPPATSTRNSEEPARPASAASALPNPPAGSASSASPSIAALLPTPTQLPASSLVTLAKFPEALEPKAAPLPKQPSEMLTGKLMWGQEFRSSASRFTAFTVYLAEGPIELPVVDRMRASSSQLVETTQADLRFGRKVSIDWFTMGLGGPTVTARWPSPNGHHSVLLLLEVPPKDIPISEKARAYYNQMRAVEVAQRVVLGIDPLLFPS